MRTTYNIFVIITRGVMFFMVDYESKNKALIEEYRKNNDPETIGAIYQFNYKLLQKLVCKYKGLAESDDLLQECYFSVLKAVETYEIDKGAFCSYLSAVIIADLFRYIQKQCLIQIPEYMQRLITAYMKAAGDGQTDQQIMDLLNIDFETLEAVKAAEKLKQCRSIYEPASAKDNDTLLQDVLTDPAAPQLEEVTIDLLFNIELNNALCEALEALNPEQAQAVKSRFFSDQQNSGENDRAKREAKNNYNKAIRQLRKNSHLRDFYEEIFSSAFNGTGLNNFKNTHTSSVERVVTKIIIKENQLQI